jgi:hypothetical protein
LLENSQYIYIYKIINLIISSNKWSKGGDLKKWILGLENPNGLDLVEELKIIDVWLGEDPTRGQKWKYNWKSRIQGWLVRTKRPHGYGKTPDLKAFNSPEPEPTGKESNLVEIDPMTERMEIELRQSFLRRSPLLYSTYPEIYANIPYPPEWDNPGHPCQKFRRLSRGGA